MCAMIEGQNEVWRMNPPANAEYPKRSRKMRDRYEEIFTKLNVLDYSLHEKQFNNISEKLKEVRASLAL